MKNNDKTGTEVRAHEKTKWLDFKDNRGIRAHSKTKIKTTIYIYIYYKTDGGTFYKEDRNPTLRVETPGGDVAKGVIRTSIGGEESREFDVNRDRPLRERHVMPRPRTLPPYCPCGTVPRQTSRQTDRQTLRQSVSETVRQRVCMCE